MALPWKKEIDHEPVADFIRASKYRLQRGVLVGVLCPLLLTTVGSCLFLVVGSSVGWIPPLSTGTETICGFVLGGGVIGSVIGMGFGWLFRETDNIDN